MSQQATSAHAMQHKAYTKATSVHKYEVNAFSALSLLTERQEEHPACKN